MLDGGGQSVRYPPALLSYPARSLPDRATCARCAQEIRNGRKNTKDATQLKVSAGTTVAAPHRLDADTPPPLPLLPYLLCPLPRTARRHPQRVSAKAAEYLNQPTIPFRAAQEICVAVRSPPPPGLPGPLLDLIPELSYAEQGRWVRSPNLGLLAVSPQGMVGPCATGRLTAGRGPGCTSWLRVPRCSCRRHRSG